MDPRPRAALAVLLLFLSTAAAAATVTGSVSSENGSRLASKVVAAYDATGTLRGTAATTSNGTYTLNLPTGSFRLLAYDPEGVYATSFFGGADSFDTTPFVTPPQLTPFEANFVLPLGGFVRGVVLAPNAPLAGAIVEAYNLSGTRRGFTTTNANGEYALVLPAGDFKIFAYDANGAFAGEFHADTRAFADAVPVRVSPPATSTIAFALERAARVSGTVSDASNGARLDDILVYAYTAGGALVARTETDATGTFRFSLGPGQYRFVAADPRLTYANAFFAASRSFERADVVTLTAGQERHDLALRSARGALVSGRVSGAPGAVVVAYNLDGTVHATTTVDARGEYRLVLAPGEYKIAAIDPTGASATQFQRGATTFAAASAIRVVGNDVLPGLDFTQTAAARFSGIVRDAATLTPLAGMTVAAYDATGALAGQTTTATNGSYTLGVSAGTYRVLVYDTRLHYATAYAVGATTYETTPPRTVAAGELAQSDLAMRRGTRVTGTVTANGAAVEGAEVVALDGSGNRVASAAVNAGAFTIVVAPGTYRFQVLDPRSRYFPSAAVTVAVGSQSPAPLAFTLTPAKKHRAVRH